MKNSYWKLFVLIAGLVFVLITLVIFEKAKTITNPRAGTCAPEGANCLLDSCCKGLQAQFKNGICKCISAVTIIPTPTFYNIPTPTPNTCIQGKDGLHYECSGSITQYKCMTLGATYLKKLGYENVQGNCCIFVGSIWKCFFTGSNAAKPKVTSTPKTPTPVRATPTRAPTTKPCGHPGEPVCAL